MFTGLDLYVFGESYSAKFTTAFTKLMIESDEWKELKGIGVSDGLHDIYHLFQQQGATRFGHRSHRLRSLSRGFVTQSLLVASIQNQQ